MPYVTKGKYSSPQVYGVNNHYHPSKKQNMTDKHATLLTLPTVEWVTTCSLCIAGLS